MKPIAVKNVPRKIINKPKSLKKEVGRVWETNMKTLMEAAEDLKKAVEKSKQARKEFIKTYFEVYSMTYNKAEDGLPKKVVEDEDWN